MSTDDAGLTKLVDTLLSQLQAFVKTLSKSTENVNAGLVHASLVSCAWMLQASDDKVFVHDVALSYTLFLIANADDTKEFVTQTRSAGSVGEMLQAAIETNRDAAVKRPLKILKKYEKQIQQMVVLAMSTQSSSQKASFTASSFDSDQLRESAQDLLQTNPSNFNVRESMECERLTWEIIVDISGAGSLINIEPAESLSRFIKYMNFETVYNIIYTKDEQEDVEGQGQQPDTPQYEVSPAALLMNKDFKGQRRYTITQSVVDTTLLSMPLQASSKKYCDVYEGLFTCVYLLTDQCLSTEASAAEDLSGLLFEKQEMTLPVYKFITMGRLSLDTATEISLQEISNREYAHEEPGGYSIVVNVCFKKLAFGGPALDDVASGGGATDSKPNIPATNVQAMLRPCQAVEEKSYPGSIRYENVPGGSRRKLATLKDKWMPFAGDGVPSDTMHSIPYAAAMEQEGQLPPATRLLMARELIVRNDKANELVGTFVLYSGRGRQVGAQRRWMQGIIISERKKRSTKMCEVLYLNGWVIWHDSAMFAQKTRSSNIFHYDTFEEMLMGKNSLGIGDWLLQTHMFDYFVSAKDADKKKQLKILVENFKTLYKL